MKNNITCAICGDVAELVSDSNDIYIGKINKKVYVEFFSYQCDACEESFTTTEVDELNLKNIEIGIRNHNRIVKITDILK